jgi:hypothetical protein
MAQAGKGTHGVRRNRSGGNAQRSRKHDLASTFHDSFSKQQRNKSNQQKPEYFEAKTSIDRCIALLKINIFDPDTRCHTPAFLVSCS